MILLYIIAFALCIWLALFIIGKLKPLTYTYERSAYIEAPPSMLWSIIVNHRNEKDWRSNLFEVAKQQNENGMAVWKEIRRNNDVVLLKTTRSDAANNILEREIINNKNYGGTFRYEISEDGEGSQLKIKHYSEVYKGTLKIKHLLLPSLKKQFVTIYLSDVKQRALFLREERDGLLE